MPLWWRTPTRQECGSVYKRTTIGSSATTATPITETRSRWLEYTATHYSYNTHTAKIYPPLSTDRVHHPRDARARAARIISYTTPRRSSPPNAVRLTPPPCSAPELPAVHLRLRPPSPFSSCGCPLVAPGDASRRAARPRRLPRRVSVSPPRPFRAVSAGPSGICKERYQRRSCGGVSPAGVASDEDVNAARVYSTSARVAASADGLEGDAETTHWAAFSSIVACRLGNGGWPSSTRRRSTSAFAEAYSPSLRVLILVWSSFTLMIEMSLAVVVTSLPHVLV